MMTKRPGKSAIRRWDVLSGQLTDTAAASLGKLAAAQNFERLQLALAGAREAAFDWTIFDDRIVWDGAADLLSMHHNPERLASGEFFRAWMSEAGRAKLQALTEDF